MHILFICTGNICRSPVAERLATDYAVRFAGSGFRATSAGTRALAGQPIHPDAARALKALGGNAFDHRARQVTGPLLSTADLILTMTVAHRAAVLELAPRQLSRTFTLHEAAQLTSEHDLRELADLAAGRPRIRRHELADVPDPMGQAAGFHAEVAGEISRLLTPILDFCRSLNDEGRTE